MKFSAHYILDFAATGKRFRRNAKFDKDTVDNELSSQLVVVGLVSAHPAPTNALGTDN